MSDLARMISVVSALALAACSSGGIPGPGPDPGPGPGPGGCAAEQHMCGATCVSNSDPRSCGGACAPCAAPDNAVATCDGASCGYACAAGFHRCGAACVPEARACGVPLPEGMCGDAKDCGAAGECIKSACVCAAGHVACSAGCCPVTYDSASLAGVAGRGVQLEFGGDGTAYVMVQVEVGASYELRLYTRKPGAKVLERAALSIPVSYRSEAFDFAVRGDGTLFALVAPVSAESTAVELHQWRAGMTASTSERVGSAFGYDPGLGLALDGKQTVWASWSRQRSGGLDAFSLDRDGLRRSYMHNPSGTVEQTDVEWDPKGGGVYSFWGHRYTGMFQSGQVQLAGMGGLASSCPADDAAFDGQGRLWTIYNSYSSIRTYFCLDGKQVAASAATLRAPALPGAFGGPLVVDGDDTAYVAYYDKEGYAANWIASRDVQRWSRGTLPVRYGNPQGSTSPAPAYMSSARRPGSGRVSFVVLPSNATMGEMTLVDLQ